MRFAVIGATVNKEKYGYKVFRYLLDAHHEVLPINPKYDTLDGVKVFHSVWEVPLPVDYFIFVVPPNVSLTILKDLVKLRQERNTIVKVWFQPGSEDNTCLEFCKSNNIPYVANSCIMHTSLEEVKIKFFI